jgi:hypothetical protein
MVEDILVKALSNLTEDQQDEVAELSDLLTFIGSLTDVSFQSLNLSVNANLQLTVIKAWARRLEKLSKGMYCTQAKACLMTSTQPPMLAGWLWLCIRYELQARERQPCCVNIY